MEIHKHPEYLRQSEEIEIAINETFKKVLNDIEARCSLSTTHLELGEYWFHKTYPLVTIDISILNSDLMIQAVSPDLGMKYCGVEYDLISSKYLKICGTKKKMYSSSLEAIILLLEKYSKRIELINLLRT